MISLGKNQALIGENVEVLIEGPSKRNPNKMMGRTRQNKTAVFDGERNLAGSIQTVIVKDATALTLFCALPGNRMPAVPERRQETTARRHLARNKHARAT